MRPACRNAVPMQKSCYEESAAGVQVQQVKVLQVHGDVQVNRDEFGCPSKVWHIQRESKTRKVYNRKMYRRGVSEVQCRSLS